MRWWILTSSIDIYVCMYKSFQAKETNKDLIIYIPILLKWKKFSS